MVQAGQAPGNSRLTEPPGLIPHGYILFAESRFW